MPANDYYNKNNVPSTGSSGSSATIRGEYAAVETGFSKLAPLTGNGGKFVLINSGGSGQEVKTSVEVKTILGLNIGTNVQAWDATLDELAATVPTVIGKNVLQGADAAAIRTTLGAADATLVAPLASPALTGNPTAPTPIAGDNDTSIATTAFVTSAVSTATTGLAPLASPALTGTPTAPTPATADNDISIATTAFVKAQAYATLASPTFTGTPDAPTPANGNATTLIATTAFVCNGWAESTELSLTAAGSKSFTHGLGRIPKEVIAFLRCNVAEFGYAVNDEVHGVCQQNTAGSYPPLSIRATSTVVSTYSTANILIFNTTGVFDFITNANWALVFRCR